MTLNETNCDWFFDMSLKWPHSPWPMPAEGLAMRDYNEHSSRHLLLISEPLKTQWITFVFEGNAPLIYLNVFMFAQIFCDPASPTEEVSIRVFMDLCKSPFLIMC